MTISPLSASTRRILRPKQYEISGSVDCRELSHVLLELRNSKPKMLDSRRNHRIGIITWSDHRTPYQTSLPSPNPPCPSVVLPLPVPGEHIPAALEGAGLVVASANIFSVEGERVSSDRDMEPLACHCSARSFPSGEPKIDVTIRCVRCQPERSLVSQNHAVSWWCVASS